MPGLAALAFAAGCASEPVDARAQQANAVTAADQGFIDAIGALRAKYRDRRYLAYRLDMFDLLREVDAVSPQVAVRRLGLLLDDMASNGADGFDALALSFADQLAGTTEAGAAAALMAARGQTMTLPVPTTNLNFVQPFAARDSHLVVDFRPDAARLLLRQQLGSVGTQPSRLSLQNLLTQPGLINQMCGLPPASTIRGASRALIEAEARQQQMCARSGAAGGLPAADALSGSHVGACVEASMSRISANVGSSVSQLARTLECARRLTAGGATPGAHLAQGGTSSLWPVELTGEVGLQLDPIVIEAMRDARADRDALFETAAEVGSWLYEYWTNEAAITQATAEVEAARTTFLNAVDNLGTKQAIYEDASARVTEAEQELADAQQKLDDARDELGTLRQKAASGATQAERDTASMQAADKEKEIADLVKVRDRKEERLETLEDRKATALNEVRAAAGTARTKQREMKDAIKKLAKAQGNGDAENLFAYDPHNPCNGILDDVVTANRLGQAWTSAAARLAPVINPAPDQPFEASAGIDLMGLPRCGMDPASRGSACVQLSGTCELNEPCGCPGGPGQGFQHAYEDYERLSDLEQAQCASTITCPEGEVPVNRGQMCLCMPDGGDGGSGTPPTGPSIPVTLAPGLISSTIFQSLNTTSESVLENRVLDTFAPGRGSDAAP